MPDASVVFIDFPDAVKRHAMKPPIGIHEMEYLRVVMWEDHFAKRHHDHSALHAIKIAQLEITSPETGVPADAIKQFTNGDHVK